MPIETLRDFFDQIEKEIKPLDEQVVGEEIKKELDTKGTASTSDEEVAEVFAFAFHANYRDTGTGWGSYYGPQFVFPNEEGQMVEFPSIQRINDGVLEYWKIRAMEAKHPLLALRYADLFVDFYRHDKKHREGFFDMAKRVIDMSLEVCERSLDDEHGCITKLGRAFKVAKLMGRGYRFEDLKKTAIITERRIAQDDKPGLWGYVFKWLLLEDDSKVGVTEQEEKDLVADIEGRLVRLAAEEEPKAWPFECAVNLLLQYYESKNDEAALENVLGRLEKILRNDKHANSDGMLVTNYLQKLIDIHSRYQQHSFAKRAVERLTTEMGHLGDRGKINTKTISVETTITDQQKADFIEEIFKGSDLQTIVNKIAVNFVPKKDSVQTQLNDLSKRFVFQYLVTSKIVSEDGYTLAEFGSLQEDPDQHLINHLSKVMHFGTPFLLWSFEELKKRHTSEEMYAVLAGCPLFKLEERPYIEKVLSAFWQGDFLTANALMIPLIEDAVRNLFKLNKQQYIRPDTDSGGYMLITLHGLIRAGLVKAVYRGLGESMELYLDTLLCSPIGWNLRNNFAHGVNKMSLMQEGIANRLMHVLFCLSLVRARKDIPLEAEQEIT